MTSGALEGGSSHSVEVTTLVLGWTIQEFIKSSRVSKVLIQVQYLSRPLNSLTGFPGVKLDFPRCIEPQRA